MIENFGLFGDLLNPRTNMNNEFRKSLFNKINQEITKKETNDFFTNIKSKVKRGYYLSNFLDNYSKVKDRVTNIIIDTDWDKKERLELYDIFRKLNNIREDEIYLYLLSIDLSNFIINGSWHYSEIDSESYYAYIRTFTSELNKILIKDNYDLKLLINKLKSILNFYKEKRQLEFLLDYFNTIDWFVISTISISREFLRYTKVNSKYLFDCNFSKENLVERSDIIIMQDEILAVLVSRVREMYINKTNDDHSSSFRYLLKITGRLLKGFKKGQFNKKLDYISNHYKDELQIYGLKRNKENFHIATYKPSIVLEDGTIKSETNINIPKVCEVLDAFVDVYAYFREFIIESLSLDRDELPKRAKIKETKLGETYINYSI